MLREPDAPRLQHIPRLFFTYLIIGLAALVLRVSDLGQFVTIDEVKFWLPRSEQFLHALSAGNGAALPIAVQPGVTTMWLGSAGLLLRRALFAWGVLHNDTYPVLLALYRLPTALVHVAGVVFGYTMLRRLFPPVTAFVAAWLWATDPFLIAFSRVLHVDALAGTFATLSLLAACIFWYHRPHTRWLVLSGICAGLAVLSKSPALAVAPVVAGVALSQTITERTWKVGMVALLVWGGVCAATVVVLWPALWVAPMRVLEALRFGVESEGGQPHMWGNYFLGQAVQDPGLLFYPAALALRTTPWTLAGLLLLPVACLRLPTTDSPQLRRVAVLAGFVVLFVLSMSLFAKKMNRYLVPVFPVVDCLAAVGLVGTLRLLVGWWGARVGQQAGDVVNRLVLAGVGVAALLNAVWYHPYTIVYFNQALGGAPMGAHVFLSGWGEGFDLVADWLNQQPDIGGVVTATSLPSVLNPYLRNPAFANADSQGTLPGGTGYVIVSISQVQRDLAPPYQQFYGQVSPLHTVTLHGVDYAWVYQAPRPMPSALSADMGSLLRLNGYGVDTSAIRSSGTLTLSVQWQMLAPVSDDYNVFVHVLDRDGQRVAQLDVPLKSPHVPADAWQPGRALVWTHPVPLAADVPPGDYWVGLGVYHTGTFARLPLSAHTVQKDAPDDGPDVVFLYPLKIE